MVLGLWALALVWTTWWTWELWATSGLFAVGPGVMFAFWLLPTLPLFLATPFWLRGRGHAGGVVLLVVVSAAAVLFFAAPFEVPRVYFGSAGSFTSVANWMYTLLAALTLLPVGSVLVSLALVARFRTRRHH